MKKNYFIPFFFVGTLLVWLLLPFYNYSVDQWRVLHKDYHHAYKGIMINKTFLKVSYLLENKNKYDTILMGSSRNGSFDVDKISPSTYNLESSFSGISSHLHNLKVLLDNGVKIKNLWVAVNDFDIWKDSNDFEDDWSRKVYKTSLIDKLSFYNFYLFKQIDKRDIGIIKGKYNLVKSERIVEKINKNVIYKKEKDILDKDNYWKKKMTSTGAVLLGYNDSTYRIDKAVNEMNEIKKLCKIHNIKLTVFTYPSFYKTYISYNQEKVEEFKRKLASVVHFHDFYSLNHIALNELNWFDSSHFSFSIGDYMIENIKENNFLITQKNINERIMETKKSIENLIDKALPIKYIYPFHANIDLSTLTPIFILSDDLNSFYTNKHVSFKKEKMHLSMITSSSVPTVIFNKLKSKTENVILDFKITSKVNTSFKIYYKKTINSEYNDKDVFSRPIGVGTSHYHLSIPSDYINNNLRIDFADKSGNYKIHTFTIYGKEKKIFFK